MRRSLLVLALAVATAPFAVAADEAPPGPDDPARLREQKVLIGSESFRSVSVPYRTKGLPYFITSDSLIFAWHALMADSVARVELRRYAALATALREMRAALPGAVAAVEIEGDLAAGAAKRARIVVATALLLLGDELPDEPLSVLHVAESEAWRISEGTERGKPAWYGRPDPDFRVIDYARFRPTDAAAAIPEVARGQRAVRWLGFLPFRIGREEELLAFLLLRRAAAGSDAARVAFSGYPDLLGEGDEPSLLTAGLETPERLTEASFADFRRAALAAAPAVPHRDRLVDPEGVAEPSLRLLPAAAPPCAKLLADVSDRRFAAEKDPLPSGRAVAAALGSSIAVDSLDPEDAAAVAAARPFATGKTHYERFLGCLARLSEPPDERAPAFFAGPAWREKTFLTTMSGWTLLRHVWSVRMKNSTVWGGTWGASGFVEPYPVFFADLARLARDTGKRFPELEADAFSLDALEDAAALDAMASLLDSLGWETLSSLDRRERTRRVGEAVAGVHLIVRRRILFERLWRWLDHPFPNRETFERRLADYRRAARELRETGRTTLPDRMGEYAPRDTAVAARWEMLAETAERLAGLAKKELSGEAFSEDDDRWIHDYGIVLAKLLGELPMGEPEDDAPVATAVFSAPSDPATTRYRIEAVGRPRALWVLWPKGDEEILCRGVVLPWEEFESPRPLTDEEWRRRLDSR